MDLTLKKCVLLRKNEKLKRIFWYTHIIDCCRIMLLMIGWSSEVPSPSKQWTQWTSNKIQPIEWWTSKIGTKLTWIDYVRKSTHLVVVFPLCPSFTNRFCLLFLSMCLVSSFKPSKHSNLESASQARIFKNNMF